MIFYTTSNTFFGPIVAVENLNFYNLTTCVRMTYIYVYVNFCQKTDDIYIYAFSILYLVLINVV